MKPLSRSFGPRDYRRSLQCEPVLSGPKAFILHLERATSRATAVQALRASMAIESEVVAAVDGARLTQQCGQPLEELPGNVAVALDEGPKFPGGERVAAHVGLGGDDAGRDPTIPIDDQTQHEHRVPIEIGRSPRPIGGNARTAVGRCLRRLSKLRFRRRQCGVERASRRALDDDQEIARSCVRRAV